MGLCDVPRSEKLFHSVENSKHFVTSCGAYQALSLCVRAHLPVALRLAHGPVREHLRAPVAPAARGGSEAEDLRRLELEVLEGASSRVHGFEGVFCALVC